MIRTRTELDIKWRHTGLLQDWDALIVDVALHQTTRPPPPRPTRDLSDDALKYLVVLIEYYTEYWARYQTNASTAWNGWLDQKAGYRIRLQIAHSPLVHVEQVTMHDYRVQYQEVLGPGGVP